MELRFFFLLFNLRGAMTALITLCAFVPTQSAAQTTEGTAREVVHEARTPPPPPAHGSLDLPDIPNLDLAWPQAPTSPPEEQGNQTISEASGMQEELTYKATVIGLDTLPDLKNKFRQYAQSWKTNQAHNLAQLRRYTKNDEDLVVQLLRSEGYYAAWAYRTISTKPDQDGAIAVSFIISPGPRYVLREIDVESTNPNAREIAQNALSIKAGDPVDATTILAAEKEIGRTLRNTGYPFAHLGKRRVIIDHSRRDAIYILPLLPGERARFGDLLFTKSKVMSQAHVQRLSDFHRGDLYDARKVDDLQQILIASGLFNSVTPQITPTAHMQNGDRIVDVHITTTPGKTRTISGEAGYSSTDGIRTQASWEQSAFTRAEGALTLSGVLGTREQSGKSTLRFSNFRKRGQNLSLTAQISRENRAAYRARSLSFGVNLERKIRLIGPGLWTHVSGGEIAVSEETNVSAEQGLMRTRDFFIIGLPNRLNYSATDHDLNPERGFRLGILGSPELAFLGKPDPYFRSQGDFSVYFPFRQHRVILAGRLRVGTIMGTALDRIPPTRLFYSGGGGSVRGYAYQGVSSRDAFNNPTGGRSLNEFSAEIRIRIREKFGIVPFLDGGQVYKRVLPQFTNWRLGTGLGFRYYTSLGPVRLDIATPIKRRAGDPLLSLYISIGQAF